MNFACSSWHSYRGMACRALQVRLSCGVCGLKLPEMLVISYGIPTNMCIIVYLRFIYQQLYSCIQIFCVYIKIILYYIILYYIILFYFIILYYIVLYYIVLYQIILLQIISYLILYCIIYIQMYAYLIRQGQLYHRSLLQFFLGSLRDAWIQKITIESS